MPDVSDGYPCVLKHEHVSGRAAAECGNSAYKDAMTVIQDALWNRAGWRKRAKEILSGSGFRIDLPGHQAASLSR